MFKITLKAARVNAGYGQREVAKILRRNIDTIVKWENNKHEMKANDFEKLCELYQIPSEYVIPPTPSLSVEKESKI